MKTGALDLLDVGLVLVCGYNLLHLCWGDLLFGGQLAVLCEGSSISPLPLHDFYVFVLEEKWP